MINKKTIKYLILSLSFFLFFSNAEAAVTLQRPVNNLGMVGYWTFNGDTISGSTVSDVSGNGNDGTITGAVPGLGKVGQALNFDGDGDKVVTGSFNYSTDEYLSISLWFKYSALSQDGTMFIIRSGGDDFGIRGVDNAVYCQFKNSSSENAISQSYTIDQDKWYHITCVSDGSNLKQYLNGLEDDSDPLEDLRNIETTFNIGTEGVSGRDFNGAIDEVRIYNRALSANEVETIYNSGVSKFQSSERDQYSNGLVGYWSMDGSTISGSVLSDLSGNGNDGTINGNPVPTIGKSGQALEFDGSSDYVDLGNPAVLDVDDEFSLSLWFRVPDGYTGSYERMLMRGSSDYGIFFGLNNGNLGIRCNSWVNTYNAVNDGKWHNAILTYDGADCSTYLDTVSKNGREGETLSSSSDWNMAAGSGSNKFNGSIDEVRIYNKVLSQDEIKGLYNSSVNKFQSSKENLLTDGLVGHWSFDGSTISGSTVSDLSGNGNDGTLTLNPALAIGKTGQAVELDGSNYVRLATSDMDSSITINMWINADSYGYIGSPDEANTYLNIVSNERLLVSHANALGVREDDCYLYSSVGAYPPSYLGEWHMITYIWDDENGYLYSYVDSSDMSSKNCPSMVGDGVGFNEMKLGLRASNWFDGKIDEVRIYNRALSEDEINQLYRMGR